MEQETITLKVIEKTHNKVVLETESGNTFTFDPTKRLGIHGEDFYDFLFYMTERKTHSSRSVGVM